MAVRDQCYIIQSCVTLLMQDLKSERVVTNLRVSSDGSSAQIADFGIIAQTIRWLHTSDCDTDEAISPTRRAVQLGVHLRCINPPVWPGTAQEWIILILKGRLHNLYRPKIYADGDLSQYVTGRSQDPIWRMYRESTGTGGKFISFSRCMPSGDASQRGRWHWYLPQSCISVVCHSHGDCTRVGRGQCCLPMHTMPLPLESCLRRWTRLFSKQFRTTDSFQFAIHCHKIDESSLPEVLAILWSLWKVRIQIIFKTHHMRKYWSWNSDTVSRRIRCCGILISILQVRRNRGTWKTASEWMKVFNTWQIKPCMVCSKEVERTAA